MVLTLLRQYSKPANLLQWTAWNLNFSSAYFLHLLPEPTTHKYLAPTVSLHRLKLISSQIQSQLSSYTALRTSSYEVKNM